MLEGDKDEGGKKKFLSSFNFPLQTVYAWPTCMQFNSLPAAMVSILFIKILLFSHTLITEIKKSPSLSTHVKTNA